MTLRSLPPRGRFHLARLLLAGSACLQLSCAGSRVTEPTTNPLPVLLTANPSPVVIGASGVITVTLSGSGFVSSSRARWNDADRVTRFISESGLEVDLRPEDLVAQANAGRLTVVNSPPGGGTSGSLTIAVVVPKPSLTALSVTRAAAGSAPVEVILTGSGFIPSSQVQVGYQTVLPAYVSFTQLKATIPASALANPGTLKISVVNYGNGGGASEQRDFVIENGVPVLTSLVPDSAYSGVPISIGIVGSGFTNATVAQVGGLARTTAFVSSTRLNVALAAGDVAAAGTVNVTAVNPAPGGGSSAALALRVKESLPRVTSLAPASARTGQADFTLVVNGSTFNTSSVVRWNGQPRPTQYISATSVSAAIGAADVSAEGTASITVFNAATGVSNAVGLPVLSATPTLGAPVIVTLTHRHLVHDAVRRVFYASVPGSDPTRGNTITKIDQNGTIGASLPVGSEPGRMAISDDGAYLYVILNGSPTVTRIALATFTTDITFQLGSGSFGALYGEDIEVLPGLARSVAVSRKNSCCSPRHEGVAIYDDGVMRSLTTQGHTGSDRITRSSSAARLYGYNNETTEFGFRRITVLASGLQEETVRGGLISNFGIDIEQDADRIFSTNGAVVDGETMTRVGTIAAAGPVRPDMAQGRVHYLSSGQLRTYNVGDYSLIGAVADTNFSGHDTLIRWGTNGLALGGGSTIVIVSGSQVGP